jgi:hypothetical protein
MNCSLPKTATRRSIFYTIIRFVGSNMAIHS